MRAPIGQIASRCTDLQPFQDLVDFRIEPGLQRIDYRSRSTFGLYDLGKTTWLRFRNRIPSPLGSKRNPPDSMELACANRVRARGHEQL